MKIRIHNLQHGTDRVYEGDVTTIERELDAEFPWAVGQAHGDLDHILYIIDHHPLFGVEIIDSSLHPFLRS